MKIFIDFGAYSFASILLAMHQEEVLEVYSLYHLAERALKISYRILEQPE